MYPARLSSSNYICLKTRFNLNTRMGFLGQIQFYSGLMVVQQNPDQPPRVFRPTLVPVKPTLAVLILYSKSIPRVFNRTLMLQKPILQTIKTSISHW